MAERQETADKELQRQREALQLEVRSLEADKELFNHEIKVPALALFSSFKLYFWDT